MKKIITENNKKTNLLIGSVFFSVLLAESSIIFFILALHPSAVKGRAIWLYSLPRFFELILMITIAIFSAWCIKILTIPAWGDKLNKLISSSPWREAFTIVGVLLLTISRLIIIILQAFAENPELSFFLGYITHLRPIFVFFSLLGFELTLWSILANKNNLLRTLDLSKKYAYIIITIWSLLSIITIFSVFLEFLPHLGEWAIFLVWVLSTIVILAI